MSGSTSELVNLYTAIYGQAPSSQSTEALIRAEYVLGITPSDPLSKFYIVLLNVADRFQRLIRERSAAEKRYIDDLHSVTANLSKVTRDVDEAGRMLMRKAKHRTSLLSDAEVVSVDRSASPLFAYLCHAFYRASHGEQDEERIMAARLDLMATVVFLVIVSAVIFGMFQLAAG